MTQDDEAAIRQIVADMTEASGRGDAKAVTRMHTEDADFVTGRGERFAGAAEIERRLSAIFATRGVEVQVTTLNLTVRFVRPDVAIVHVTNELRGLVGPDGRQLPAQRELSIRVFTKDAAAWRAAAFHNAIVNTQVAAP